MFLKVKLLRPGARAPKRAHATDAGADIFYCPDLDNPNPNPCRLAESNEFHVYPGASCIIPTGIRVEVPADYMLEIKNKSSVAARRQLVVGACVVDSGYDGEIFVNLHNIGACTQILTPGDKLAQIVLIQIEACQYKIVEDEINENTSRGTGGFGSTGSR